VIVSIISATAYVLSLAIFFRAILSWFPAISPRNPISEFLFTVTEPILAPLRRVIPRVGMMDVSPMIAILILAYVVPAIIHA
jgi:YggT family protein